MPAKELTDENHCSRLSCSKQLLIDVNSISFSDKILFTSH